MAPGQRPVGRGCWARGRRLVAGGHGVPLQFPRGSEDAEWAWGLDGVLSWTSVSRSVGGRSEWEGDGANQDGTQWMVEAGRSQVSSGPALVSGTLVSHEAGGGREGARLGQGKSRLVGPDGSCSRSLRGPGAMG